VSQPQGSYQHTPMPTPSKSNTKLIVGIAAILFVIIIGTAAVLFIMRKPGVPSAAPVSQPVQSTAPSPAPSAGAGQPSIPVSPPPQAPPPVEIARPAGESLSGATVPAGENANATKGPKPARKESNAEAAARKEKERKAAEARRLLNQ
jgi:hypothetical protein